MRCINYCDLARIRSALQSHQRTEVVAGGLSSRSRLKRSSLSTGGHEPPCQPSGARALWADCLRNHGTEPYSLGNGDGLRPRSGHTRPLQGNCSDNHRSEESKHLSTSRYFSYQWDRRRLVSHWILKHGVEPEFGNIYLSWSPVTESNRRPSPYHACRFRMMPSA
jgi:hypothetical protein